MGGGAESTCIIILIIPGINICNRQGFTAVILYVIPGTWYIIY